MAGLSDLLTMRLFLAYALACQELGKWNGKTAKEIERELDTKAQLLLETDKISPAELEAFMKSVMPDSEI